MRTTLEAVLAVALLAALGACGSSDDAPERIGCAWFTGDNCWKQSVAAAVACTDGSATGTFGAGTTSCGYDDGTAVAFATPATESFFADAPWSFSISSGGGTCLEFRETDDSVTLTTTIGTYREEFPAATVLITCPDGSRYQIGALDALGCGFQNLPGHVVVESGGQMTFSLMGAPPGDTVLWRCAP